MHGVQPAENVAPKSNELKGPGCLTGACMRRSRSSVNSCNKPVMYNPNTMTMTPPRRRTTPIWAVSKRLTELTLSPNATKTSVKPSTKNMPFSNNVLRLPAPSACSSSKLLPVKYVTYAGNNGNTHGEMNETKPAANASDNVSCSVITVAPSSARHTASHNVSRSAN